MGVFTWKRFWILLGLLVVVAGGYFASMMLPGGALAGKATDVPADWTDVEVPDIVQFETNPADPYSVNIWAVPLGPYIYIHRGDSRSRWVEHIEADPSVRLLVSDRLYEMTALRVTDSAEFADFSAAYETRYGRRPGNENVAEVYVFRLAARQAHED